MLNDLMVCYTEQDTFKSIQDAKIKQRKITKDIFQSMNRKTLVVLHNSFKCSLFFPTSYHLVILLVFASMLLGTLGFIVLHISN
jgi:hypothetical protein